MDIFGGGGGSGMFGGGDIFDAGDDFDGGGVDPFGGGDDDGGGGGGDIFGGGGGGGGDIFGGGDDNDDGGGGGDIFGGGSGGGGGSTVGGGDDDSGGGAAGGAGSLFGGGGGGGGGNPFLGSSRASRSRDADLPKWPRCADMRATIYGCAWYSRDLLVVGDAAGTFKYVNMDAPQCEAKDLANVGAPIVCIAACPRLAGSGGGVFTADPSGYVTQWDVASNARTPCGPLGQAMAFDQDSGVLAVASWAKHVAVVDVRFRNYSSSGGGGGGGGGGRPSCKIVTPGRCHCVDIHGNTVFVGVNHDRGKAAVLLYDRRRTAQPLRMHRLRPREGLVRCLARRPGTGDADGGFVYGTLNGFVGIHPGAGGGGGGSGWGGGREASSLTAVAEVANLSARRELGAEDIFGNRPPPNIVVNSLSFNSMDGKFYFALSNGQILRETAARTGARRRARGGARERLCVIRFRSSESLSCIAFSGRHAAVCRSYNYFDFGERQRAGGEYPFHEVMVRTLKAR